MSGKAIARNTGIGLAGTGLSRVLGLVIIVIVTRGLGVEAFGLFSFAVGFSSILVVLADLGINNLLQREIARQRGAVNAWVSNALTIKILLSIVTVAATVLAAWLLGYREETLRLVLLAIITLSIESITGVLASAFVAFEKVGVTTTINTGRTALRLGLIALLAVSGLNAMTILFVYLLSQLASLIAHSLTYHLHLNRFRWDGRWKQGVGVLRKGFPFGMATIFIMIYFKIDIAMLSSMQGDAAVGLYSAAYNLIDSLSYIPIALSTALLPVASRFYGGKNKELIDLAEQSVRFLFMLSLPIAVGTTVLAPGIIQLLYGPTYRDAAAALAVLAWTTIPLFYTYLLGLLLVASDHEKIGMFTTGGAAALNILLNFLLIPSMSFVGAAIATVATEFCLMVLNIYFVRTRVIRVGLPATWKPMLASGVMAGALVSLRSWPVLISIAFGAAVYVTVLFGVRGLTRQDVKFVLSFLKN